MKYVIPSEEMRLTVIDGKVCEGTICGVILTIVEGDVVVDGYRFKHNGKETILPAEQEFYFDENTFKLGQPIIPRYSWNGLSRLAGWDRLTLWYYKNGKAEPWEWKKELISWEILSNNNAKLLNGFIPDELFGEQENVYSWHDLIVHKDNGDVEFKKAPLSVLRLNDKQKVLFERYKALLKEMNDADMLIVEDRDSCNLVVLNCSEYEVGFECDNDFEPVFPIDMQFVIRNHTYYYGDNGERMNICKKK
jgi:hypothetical protein